MEEEYKVQGLDTCDDAIKMAVMGKQQILQQGYVNISVTTNKDWARISIEPPEGQDRVSHDIVCVLDISGSMDTEASVKNKDGNKESQGLTYLDILKHATSTVINNLTEKDRFALISYSDDSRLEFGLTNMTKDNIQLAQQAIENLQTEGSTNIWQGIFQAMELLRESQKTDSNQTIILLTDGEPNIFPPSGYVNQLKKYKKMFKDFYFSINTFAFGKNIDTPLLDDYAMIGNGQYSFIPCPGFIGTIFVNSLANILNTMASKCKLTLEFLNGAQLIQFPGGLTIEKNTIQIGDIKFGQTRDIVVQVKYPEGDESKDVPFLGVKVEYYDYVNKTLRIGEAKENRRFDWDDPMVYMAQCRAEFVDKVKLAVAYNKDSKQPQGIELIKNLSQFIEIKINELEQRAKDIQEDQTQLFELGRNEYTRKFLTNLKKDVDGEVKLAITQMHSFNHWGKHFLPSLCHCHMKQQCNNFCDPGIQGYGGEMFQTLKDKAEMVFLKLPPPKPSRKKDYDYYADYLKKQQQPNAQNQQKKLSGRIRFRRQCLTSSIRFLRYVDLRLTIALNNLIYKKKINIDKLKFLYFYDFAFNIYQIAHPHMHVKPQVIKPQQQLNQPEPQPRQRTPSPEVDIAQYYNCGGGCFAPSCKVQLSNGEYKSISTIKQQDILFPNNKIRFIVKIKNSMKKSLLCSFPGGLKLTHNHPFLYQNKWQKPTQIIEPELQKCEYLYNFVLENGNSVTVNGIQCVTFGHQIQEAFHPYFGSEKIIKDLEKQNIEQGIITIRSNQFTRNQDTLQVIGIN